jgi:hypothetical protein
MRALADDAMVAAHKAITYWETVGPLRHPDRREGDPYAEGVRVAFWRLELYLGSEHDLVGAYRAVTEAFDRWTDVIVGANRAVQRLERPDHLPIVTGWDRLVLRFSISPFKKVRAWVLANRQTRDALHAFSEAALPHVGLSSAGAQNG